MPRLDVEAILERRRVPTALFVGLVLLAAGIKWTKGWPLGGLIVLAIGAFYLLVPVYRWPAQRLLLTMGFFLVGLVLQAVAGDSNSPVSGLGMTLISLGTAGSAFSPVLLRPRWFEALGPSEEVSR